MVEAVKHGVVQVILRAEASVAAAVPGSSVPVEVGAVVRAHRVDVLVVVVTRRWAPHPPVGVPFVVVIVVEVRDESTRGGRGGVVVFGPGASTDVAVSRGRSCHALGRGRDVGRPGARSDLDHRQRGISEGSLGVGADAVDVVLGQVLEDSGHVEVLLHGSAVETHAVVAGHPLYLVTGNGRREKYGSTVYLIKITATEPIYFPTI